MIEYERILQQGSRGYRGVLRIVGEDEYGALAGVARTGWMGGHAAVHEALQLEIPEGQPEGKIREGVRLT